MAAAETEVQPAAEAGQNVSAEDVAEEQQPDEAGNEVVGVKCVLLDIEGTICPISFVKDTLFPYAIKALPSILATKWNDDEFKPYREAFPEDKRTSPEALQAYVEKLTREDRKDACHKNLQGFLWKDGYKTGAYATPLFPDVASRFKQWKGAGLTLAIYSSGSVFAQKLLFGHVQVRPPPIAPIDEDLSHANAQQAAAGQKRSLDDDNASSKEPRAKRPATEKGGHPANVAVDPTPSKQHPDLETEDLQHLITDWFDTVNAGPKKEASSYRKIAETLELTPEDILFLTDSVEEYDASTAAGLKAGLMMRPGNPPLEKGEDVHRFKMMWSLQNVTPLLEDHAVRATEGRA